VLVCPGPPMCILYRVCVAALFRLNNFADKQTAQDCTDTHWSGIGLGIAAQVFLICYLDWILAGS